MGQNKNIPNDVMILYSYLNTQLRDDFSSLEDLCKSLDVDQAEMEAKMESIGYYYDHEKNKFI